MVNSFLSCFRGGHLFPAWGLKTSPMASTAPMSARESRPREVKALGIGPATPRGRPTNPLLLRSDVGRAKPSCYDLPDNTFTFGRPGPQDEETARDVSMNWQNHVPSVAPDRTATNFVAHNMKISSRGGAAARPMMQLVDAGEPALAPGREAEARSTPRSGSFSARGCRNLLPSDVVPGFTYGRKVRLSTPIHDVISARFAENAETDLNDYYTEFLDARDANRAFVRKIPLTKAARGHAMGAKAAIHADAAPPKEPFKISRFTRIGAKVNTRNKQYPGAFPALPDEVFSEPEESPAAPAVAADLSTSAPL